MPDNKFLTQEGFNKLNVELKKCLKKRAKIATRIEEAKSLGDLSENADYAKAKEEQAFNEGKIEEIERTLSTAEIVNEKKGNNKVAVNKTVSVKDNQGSIYQYKIVGSGEADPVSGKISYESPLGKQFLGKRVNDVLKVKTPAGQKVYKVIKIS